MQDPADNEIGEALRRLRTQRGQPVGQRTLSRRVGRSDAYVQGIEEGRIVPSPSNVLDICKALNREEHGEPLAILALEARLGRLDPALANLEEELGAALWALLGPHLQETS